MISVKEKLFFVVSEGSALEMQNHKDCKKNELTIRREDFDIQELRESDFKNFIMDSKGLVEQRALILPPADPVSEKLHIDFINKTSAG